MNELDHLFFLLRLSFRATNDFPSFPFSGTHHVIGTNVFPQRNITGKLFLICKSCCIHARQRFIMDNLSGEGFFHYIRTHAKLRAWRHQDVAHVPFVPMVLSRERIKQKTWFSSRHGVFLLTSCGAALSLSVTSYIIHRMRGISEQFWGRVHPFKVIFNKNLISGVLLIDFRWYCHKCEGSGEHFWASVHAH